ncbi:MAG: RdgB/HAM1 family non-canonical purine NTP pyrophosphatase [Pseudomonadales bacterium]
MALSKIVIASGNEHKIAEIRAVLPASLELVSQRELAISEPPETGLTFVENAIIKARNATRESGLSAIADDSGLEVAALDGAPGIYSSRYAGEDATDHDNNEKLLHALSHIPSEGRGAQFHCVIVFMRHERDPAPVIASGTLKGEIIQARRGSNGFGYDPLFLVPPLGKTVAELTSETKNQISHRALALAQLKTLMSI